MSPLFLKNKTKQASLLKITVLKNTHSLKKKHVSIFYKQAAISFSFLNRSRLFFYKKQAPLRDAFLHFRHFFTQLFTQ